VHVYTDVQSHTVACRKLVRQTQHPWMKSRQLRRRWNA